MVRMRVCRGRGSARRRRPGWRKSHGEAPTTAPGTRNGVFSRFFREGKAVKNSTNLILYHSIHQAFYEGEFMDDSTHELAYFVIVEDAGYNIGVLASPILKLVRLGRLRGSPSANVLRARGRNLALLHLLVTIPST